MYSTTIITGLPENTHTHTHILSSHLKSTSLLLQPLIYDNRWNQSRFRININSKPGCTLLLFLTLEATPPSQVYSCAHLHQTCKCIPISWRGTYRCYSAERRTSNSHFEFTPCLRHAEWGIPLSVGATEGVEYSRFHSRTRKNIQMNGTAHISNTKLHGYWCVYIFKKTFHCVI